MLNAIIRFSIRQKLLVGLFVLMMAAYGVFQFTRLPIDAVPDITNNQVQVITVAPSYGATDIERLVTFSVEQVMSNIPGIKEMRSFSRFGLSLVTIVFDDATDVYWARQQVAERLQRVQTVIPPGIGTPELGPVTTGLGEIYQYVVKPKPGFEKKYSATDLRTIQDWMVRRSLLTVKGVAEVSSFGGKLKQYSILVNPAALQSHGISIADVFRAVQENNQNSGGAYIEKASTVLYIRSEGLINKPEEIGSIRIKSLPDGSPLFIRDVAEVTVDHATRYGALLYDHHPELAGAVVMMLKGANSNEVIGLVKERIKQIQQTLPVGVEIEPFLDRTKMVNSAIGTVKQNLLEGALIVVLVLVLFLGQLRAGLLVASVIPLSMLFAVIMMNWFGVSGNLMSLGALDFGLIVDGAVIIVEAVIHRLTHSKHFLPIARLEQSGMDQTVESAAGKMMNSAVFGQIIILIVYLPIFSLEGIEGKMFKPMAQTVSFALLGAFLLSLTYVPMMSTLILGKKIRHQPTLSDKLMFQLERVYQHALNRILRIPKTVIAMVLLLFAGAIILLTTLGAEFIPTLEEGDFAVDTRVLTGSSLSTTIAETQKAADLLKERFPEVEKVVVKIGSGEVPTDPMPIEAADMMVILKPKNAWTSAKSFNELATKMSVALQDIPGITAGFQYPVQMRFNELMTGARQDVVCKIYGDDLDTLAHYASRLGDLVKQIDGARNLYVESVSGLAQIVVRFNRAMLAQYRVSIDEVNRVMHASLAGEMSGQVYEGDQRFDVLVKIRQQDKQNLDAIRQLLIPTSGGQQVPLSMLADVNIEEGPNQIQRENARRRIVVGFNVRGRDVQSVVHDLQQKITQQLKLPSGYLLTYGGSFENLEAAKKRLLIAVPVSLMLIFLLLYFAFRSFRQGLLIYSAIPLSAIGGILFLALRGMPFSISAGVGFIALFGVAVLNGIVLIAEFNQIRADGLQDLRRVVLMGTKVRLRPVLMTAMVASMGFIPMALSNGAGAEVQRPLATVVIGGLLIATLLTLFVLPILYVLFESTKNSKMKIPASMLILLPVLFVSFSGIAQPLLPANTLSLKAAQDSALQHAWIMRTADNQLRYRKLMQKTAVQIPATNLLSEAGELNSRFIDSRIAVSQSFELPVTYKRKRKQLDAAYDIAATEKELSAVQLAKQVAMLFSQYHYFERKRQTELHYDSLYRALKKQADIRLKSGETDATESVYLGNMLLQHQQRLRAAEASIAIVLNDWNWLLQTRQNYLPGNLHEPDWQVKDSTAVSDHPQLQQYLQYVQLAETQVQIERNALLPLVQLGYANGTMKGIGADDKRYSGSDRFQFAQLGFSIPLFNKATRSRIAAARQAVLQAKDQYQAASTEWEKDKQNLQHQYEQALTDWQMATIRAQPLTRELEKHIWERRMKGDISFIEWAQYMNQVIQWDEAYIELDYRRQQTLLEYQYYLNSTSSK